MALQSSTVPGPEFDRINQRTWRTRGARRQFATASGWLDAGERAAIDYAAPQASGRAILDIGIGGGRTAPLMADISANYRGIDYCDTMVEAARARFPALCFHEMDARRLTFADDSFDLVTFSYNGIDAVDMPGRLAILRQVHRVLCPGGYFVFSTLNREGSAYGEAWPDLRVFNSVSSPLGVLRAAARLAVGGMNRWRLRRAERRGADVAIGTLSAHNFGLIALFTSVGEQLRQLQESGFDVAAIFDPEGRPIASDGTEATSAPWCHFVARKVAVVDAS